MLKSLAISVLDECLTGKKKKKERGAQVAKGKFIVTEKAVKERCLLSHRLVLERFVKPHKALIHKTFLWLNFPRAIIPIWKEVEAKEG